MHAKKKAGPSSTRQLRACGRSDRAKMDPSVLSSAFSSLSRSDGKENVRRTRRPAARPRLLLCQKKMLLLLQEPAADKLPVNHSFPLPHCREPGQNHFQNPITVAVQQKSLHLQNGGAGPGGGEQVSLFSVSNPGLCFHSLPCTFWRGVGGVSK